MTEREALLIPNLGAEEGGDWAASAKLPAVATTTRLWRLLFGTPNRLIGLPPDDAAGARGDPASEERAVHEGSRDPRESASGASGPPELADAEGWPRRLGGRPEAPVFDWLGAEGGVFAWLADEGARARAESLGHALAACPAEIVARAHDKAFAVREAEALGYTPRALAGLLRIFEPAELGDADAFVRALTTELAGWPEWTGGRFTLKPRFGSSGRGRVAGQGPNADTPSLRGALPRLAARGGALLEPWLERSVDLSVLLRVTGSETTASPEVTLLGSLEQWVSASGVYLGHLGEVDSRGRLYSGSRFDEATREAAAALAGRAGAVGYRGPCGVDGFAFRVPENGAAEAPGSTETGTALASTREVLRPVVELNARFTAGLVAMGLVRRALPSIRGEIGLETGQRCAFLFALDLPSGWPSWQQAAESVGDDVALVPLWRPGDGDRPALLFARTLQPLQRLRPAGSAAAASA